MHCFFTPDVKVEQTGLLSAEWIKKNNEPFFA